MKMEKKSFIRATKEPYDFTPLKGVKFFGTKIKNGNDDYFPDNTL